MLRRPCGRRWPRIGRSRRAGWRGSSGAGPRPGPTGTGSSSSPASRAGSRPSGAGRAPALHRRFFCASSSPCALDVGDQRGAEGRLRQRAPSAARSARPGTSAARPGARPPTRCSRRTACRARPRTSPPSSSMRSAASAAHTAQAHDVADAAAAPPPRPAPPSPGGTSSACGRGRCAAARRRPRGAGTGRRSRSASAKACIWSAWPPIAWSKNSGAFCVRDAVRQPGVARHDPGDRVRVGARLDQPDAGVHRRLAGAEDDEAARRRRAARAPARARAARSAARRARLRRPRSAACAWPGRRAAVAGVDHLPAHLDPRARARQQRLEHAVAERGCTAGGS